MHATDALTELTLDDLIADAVNMALPAPRAPRATVDLTALPPQEGIRIPDATVTLVDGYTDYGA
jgi:hypothetical protein